MRVCVCACVCVCVCVTGSVKTFHVHMQFLNAITYTQFGVVL